MSIMGAYKFNQLKENTTARTVPWEKFVQKTARFYKTILQYYKNKQINDLKHCGDSHNYQTKSNTKKLLLNITV